MSRSPHLCLLQMVRIFFMIARVSIHRYHDATGNRNFRRALAFAIFMKNLHPASVVKGWSLRKISEETGLAPNTCRKYIDILCQMRLAFKWRKNGIKYLRFGKLRRGWYHGVNNKGKEYWCKTHKADIIIDHYDLSSVENIEKGLMAQTIFDNQMKKEFVRQLVRLGREKPKFVKHKRIKRADRICNQRGYTVFRDYGLSYKTIAAWNRCGYSTVTKIIKYGERVGLFVKNTAQKIAYFVGYGRGADAFTYLDRFEGKHFHFYTRSNLYIQPANTFSLPKWAIPSNK